jgi:ketosteroid isomerase-like protein
MSRENAELMRQVFDAFNRRDLDSVVALMDEGVEAYSRLSAIEGEGAYHGHEGMRLWWESLLGVFPDFAVEVVETRDFGDATLGVLRNRGHGEGSDTPVEEDLWLVAWWRQGKCTRWTAYVTEAEALEAVSGRSG